MGQAFPSDMLTQFGPRLAEGDIDGIVQRYAMPFSVAMQGEQQIVETLEDACFAFRALREQMLERGMVDARSQMKSQAFVGDDMVVATVETEYFDASQNPIDRTLTSYLLRGSDTEWNIAMISIDQPIRDIAGLCVSKPCQAPSAA